MLQCFRSVQSLFTKWDRFTIITGTCAWLWGYAPWGDWVYSQRASELIVLKALLLLSLNIYRLYYLLFSVKYVSSAAEMALVVFFGTAPMRLQSKRKQEYSWTGNKNIFKIFRIAPSRVLARPWNSGSLSKNHTLIFEDLGTGKWSLFLFSCNKCGMKM